jgi:hypothetical protein
MSKATLPSDLPLSSRRNFVRKMGAVGLGSSLIAGAAALVGSPPAQAKQVRTKGMQLPYLNTPSGRVLQVTNGCACGSGCPNQCIKATGKCPGGPCEPAGHCCYYCQDGCGYHYVCANTCVSTFCICGNCCA